MRNSTSHPRWFAPLLLLTASCAAEQAQAPDPLRTLTEPARLAELESTIPALLDSGDVAGISIAIVTDTGIVWSRGFGVRSAEQREPVDANTVFEAASLSKPVFAFAVLQLVDQGVLDLDTPLAAYYEYEDIAHEPRGSLISARMVLTHSSGFPNWRPSGGDLTINFEPGSEFSYSGEGFVYLQHAVAHLTGESLQELVSRLVFQPLGMQRSSYVWEERFEDNFAHPHSSNGDTLTKRKPSRGGGNAAASLHTTAPDFARFLMALMNGRGLSDTLAAAMLAPQIEVDSSLAWGLGIGLQAGPRGRAFWHWGDNTGFKAFTIAYPESGVGVVWFTNSNNGHSILEALLAATVGDGRPAVAWLDYEAYDAPSRRVRDELARTIDEDGVEAGIARYRELRSSAPPEAFDEYLLNTLGYRMLSAERITDAIAIFTLNVEEYPDAWNPYDSLGEAYMEAGELDKAIEYYEKSVELNPENTNGIAALERLRALRTPSQ